MLALLTRQPAVDRFPVSLILAQGGGQMQWVLGMFLSSQSTERRTGGGPTNNNKRPKLFRVSRSFWHKKPNGNQGSQHTDKSTFGVVEYTISGAYQ